MKGIYFSQVRAGEVSQGAVMKIFDEIKAFEKEGFVMRHVNFEPISKGARTTHIGKGICAAIPFTYIFSKYQYDSSFDDFDFYYFRFEAVDFWMMRFMKQLKMHNPRGKIVIEFPDYPNTVWMKGVLYTPLLLKDYAARRKYHKYVDRFAVLNPVYKEIYGVKTVPYMNGIDVSRIPVRVPHAKTDDSQIDIIGICTMFPVHGYDRFMESMARYYADGNKRNVVLHIVGDGPGPELKRYQTIVQKHGLSEHVIFEGRLTGNALTDCYNKCDLGVEVFAAFRKGLQVSSSLKSREYLCRGIPIITACDIDILINREFPYILQFENNNSLVDIRRVVEFHDAVYRNETEGTVIQNIRKFAEDHCSYNATLQQVIEYIKSEA